MALYKEKSCIHGKTKSLSLQEKDGDYLFCKSGLLFTVNVILITIAFMSSQSVIEQIKQHLDIVDVVGSYVTLKHAGKYFKASCPFHQEKTASFVVSPEIARWHCFGACHEGGDIFSFVMKWENITFAEALKLLAERAGVTLTNDTKSVGYQDPDAINKDVIFKITELSARYFAYLLQKAPIASLARQYLIDRGLTDKITASFQLGYAPEGWTNLRDYLSKKNFQDSELLLSGLFVQGDRGIYDRFRGRLMFPIQNQRGQIVGFSGRLIKQEITDKDGGKYINTPETLVYHKRESLYGLFHTKDEIRKQNRAMVVEGEFDMLSPFEKGIGNIVAIKGSAFTDDQLRILRRYCSRLILALDNDDAGFDALRKTTIDAQQFGFELYVCPIPGGKDPDEAARHHLGELKQAIAHPTPVYDHIIDTLFNKVDVHDPFSKKAFAEATIPYINLIDNPIVRTHYVQKVATLLQSTESNVLELIRDYRKRIKTPIHKVDIVNIEETKPHERAQLLQKHILSSLISSVFSQDILSQVTSILRSEDFTDGPYRILYSKFIQHIEKPLTSNFLDSLTGELRPIYDELYLYSSLVEPVDEKSIVRLALEYKKIHITSIIQDKPNDDESDGEELNKLILQRSEVEKRLKSV